MTDVIKILESLEKSGLLIDWATNTVKHETKKQEGDYLVLSRHLWLHG